MRYLILGGTGFLGEKVSKYLADNGHHVMVYSPSAGRQVFKSNIIGVSGFISDKGAMRKHIAWADVIFHFVSTTNPKSSFSDPVHDISSNLIPMVELLEELKNHPTKKIVFCSSGGAVYGPVEYAPIPETHIKRPTTSYGLVKSAIEEYINYYHLHFGIQYLIIRPANVYGPKFRSISEQGIISTLVFNGIHECETKLWASTSNVRDYLFIDDFASAIISLMEVNASGIFNIGSGKGYSLNEVIAMVEEVQQKEVRLSLSAELTRDEPSNVLDISKIMQTTGWMPSWSLRAGIAEVDAAMRQHEYPLSCPWPQAI